VPDAVPNAATPSGSRAPQIGRPTPLVSVVLPTFNRVHYLPASIQSVLDQSVGDFEIIVQDNASVEDPAPLLARIGDPRIRYYRNTRNIGQTNNIVNASSKARGKYLAILGDDDLWQPDFLSTLVPPLEQDTDIVVSFCSHDIIDRHGVLDPAFTAACNRRFRDGLSAGVHAPFVDIALIRRSICVMSGAVFRREALDWRLVPPDLPYMSDVYICYLAVRTGKRCYYHPAMLMHRRELTESVSVEATASVQSEEIIARAALTCWDTLSRDPTVAAGRRYFAMKRADNALRILKCNLWMRRWGVLLRELWAFLRHGVIAPWPLLAHFRYGRH
jgi:glycosyltransferase involved in cell wall biosynthesis